MGALLPLGREGLLGPGGLAGQGALGALFPLSLEGEGLLSALRLLPGCAGLGAVLPRCRGRLLGSGGLPGWGTVLSWAGRLLAHRGLAAGRGRPGKLVRGWLAGGAGGWGVLALVGGGVRARGRLWG